ncbi:lipoprotein [Leptospira perolatii]|uniref:Lipoprotein n=1 Tax=Leptospira perolatii TaxID=2023191 RepID=A0A2M9ZIR3_9LEPT|nr:TIGR04452 family lipoprotein [Leptospira perolatii]PJZ68355.1 lipoprotein [Leptospira perolatii]PJZ71843.1 lipoprotein [Leptospira perolatii]
MKKIITLLLPFALMANCILLDSVGLSVPETVSGKEAKNTILTSAVLGSAAGGFSVLSILAPQFAQIEEDKYYNKKDVDECANEALLFNAITVDIGGLTCDLHPRPVIVWPIY